MSEPLCSQKSPYQIKLNQGKFFWCACGESKAQPFCDGTHKTKRLFKPLAFELPENKEVWLCACKRSSNPPFCDGSHKKL